MRKKLTLTIDADVYDMIKELPRSVSVSEAVTFFLKTMCQDLKKGRELTQEEYNEWLDSTPEGKDFHDRFIEQFGPSVKKIDSVVNGLKEQIKAKKKKK